MSTYWLALRQIRRNPVRTTLMAGGVAAAAAATVAVALMVAGANRSVTKSVSRLGADIMAVPSGEDVARKFNEALLSGKPATFYLSPEQARAAATLPGVLQSSPQTFLETLDNARCCAGKFFVVGFDPQSDFTVSPWLRSGRIPDAARAENGIIVGDRILLREGDTASFYGTEFEVSGVLAATGTGMDWTIYLPEPQFSRMVAQSRGCAERALNIPAGAASAVFIKAKPGIDSIDLAEQIEQAVPGVQAVLSSTLARAAGRELGGIAVALAAGVAVLWLMAMLLTGVIFSQSVREQQAELGLLVAKGADAAFILRLVAAQCAMIAAVGAAFGCTAGAVAAALAGNVLASSAAVPDALLPLPFIALLAGASFALISLSSAAAALLPALRLLKAEPCEALRGEVIA